MSPLHRDELLALMQGSLEALAVDVGLPVAAALLEDAVPELKAALGMLPAARFAKTTAFLKSPACRRVRTNNPVERVNRKLRHQEEARYK